MASRSIINTLKSGQSKAALFTKLNYLNAPAAHVASNKYMSSKALSACSIERVPIVNANSLTKTQRSSIHLSRVFRSNTLFLNYY